MGSGPPWNAAPTFVDAYGPYVDEELVGEAFAARPGRHRPA
ncbi:hypothetical protein AB0L14_12425 [Streptomyces sp. NPDC052727]